MCTYTKWRIQQQKYITQFALIKSISVHLCWWEKIKDVYTTVAYSLAKERTATTTNCHIMMIIIIVDGGA